jgi:hypothetical protein
VSNARGGVERAQRKGYSDGKSRESERVGFRVGDRSRGRFTTSADFPLHGCSQYSHVHASRECWDLSIVQGPFLSPRAKP